MDAKVVVLAGGFATRLRPLSCTKPKPLLPVLGKPLLSWILEKVKEEGFDEVIVSLRFMYDKIMNRYGESYNGIRIRYAIEHKPLGDAGPLKLIDKEYGLDETFIVVNGDIFTNASLKEALDFHRKKGGAATIVLTKVEDPSRYGVAVLDVNHRIVDFVEKPGRRAPSNLVNAGIYIFEPEVLKLIPEASRVKLAVDVIPKLLESSDVYGYVHRGYWFDIGVPGDYWRANIEALHTLYPQGYVDPEASVSPEAEILQPVYIAKGVKIEKQAKIGPDVVIGPNAVIGSRARVSRSIILDKALIDDAATVIGAVVGDEAIIGKWARVEEGAIIGDGVVIDDEVLVSRGTRICPFKELKESIHKPCETVL